MKSFSITTEDAEHLQAILQRIARYNNKQCKCGKFLIQKNHIFAGEGADLYFFNGIFNPTNVQASIDAEYINTSSGYYKAPKGTLIVSVQYDNPTQLAASLNDIVGTYQDFTSFIEPTISNVFTTLYPQHDEELARLFVEFVSKYAHMRSSDEDNYAKPIPISELAPYITYQLDGVTDTGFNIVFTCDIDAEQWM